MDFIERTLIDCNHENIYWRKQTQILTNEQILIN